MGERLLVAGDRRWHDISLIRLRIADYHETHTIDVIIEGDAPGADRLAGQVAFEFGIPFLAVPARWDTEGKSAGPRRNIRMMRFEPTEVMLFHDALESSKGTKSMARIALRHGVQPIVHTHSGSYFPTLEDVT